MNQRRVVVTGMGVLSCIGSDTNHFFHNLVNEVSGITIHPDIPGHPVGWIESVPEAQFSKTELLGLDRVSQFALIASKQAVDMSGLNLSDTDRCGVLYGTALGGATTLESSYANFFGVRTFTRALTIPMAMMHAPASQISIYLGIRGECQTYSTACSSSSVAIGEGFRKIKDGYLDIAITGGAECMLLPGVVGEWAKLRVLAQKKGNPSQGCSPFSQNRSGFHLSEGAATIILEERQHAIRRGAKILGEVVGFGVSNDGIHITKPSAIGQSLAIKRALKEANISPDDIGYINLHGTATKTGDLVEAESINNIFGNCASTIPVSATKPLHGHAIGATGAMEFIVTLLAINKELAPPTAFTQEVDPACSIDLVTRNARQLSGIKFAASNSFAFGGNNAVLILGKSDI